MPRRASSDGQMLAARQNLPRRASRRSPVAFTSSRVEREHSRFVADFRIVAPGDFTRLPEPLWRFYNKPNPALAKDEAWLRSAVGGCVRAGVAGRAEHGLDARRGEKLPRL